MASEQRACRICRSAARRPAGPLERGSECRRSGRRRRALFVRHPRLLDHHWAAAQTQAAGRGSARRPGALRQRLFRKPQPAVNLTLAGWGENGRMSGWGNAARARRAPAALRPRGGRRRPRPGRPTRRPAACRPGFTPIPMTALASGHHSVAVMLNGRPGRLPGRYRRRRDDHPCALSGEVRAAPRRRRGIAANPPASCASIRSR